MIRFLLLLLSLWSVMAYGQQIPLKGIVTVQNSRVNTGKTEYVSEASISHPNAKPTATDSRGAFTLQILRLKNGAQTAIKVKPTGRYKDYIVVDERLIKDITLGRTTPISICIQDRRILEEREKRLIAVTVKKQNEIRERKIAELNKRIAALEEANDYANEQYQKSIDSLTLLANDKGQAIKRIREYAKDMVLINLDEADSIYRRAYQFFEEGELDSVASYLRRHINFEEESKQIQQQLREAQEEKSLARELDKQADQKIANAEDAQAQLLKKLLLAAKANAELYNHNEAEQYYEQALAIARRDDIITFTYLNCLNEYTNYIKIHTNRLKEETNRLEEENKLSERKINRLEEENKLSERKINRLEEETNRLEEETNRLEENLEEFQTCTLLALKVLGDNCFSLKDYLNASNYYSEAAQVCEDLCSFSPEKYQDILAHLCNRAMASYDSLKDYAKAIDYGTRVLNIYEKLSVDDPKTYAPLVASLLLDVGIKYSNLKNHIKSSEYYTRAIAIYEQLETEHSKEYLLNLSIALNNLGFNYEEQKDYTHAIEYYLRALAIRERLVQESVEKPSLLRLLSVLRNLSRAYNAQNNYSKTMEYDLHIISVYEKMGEDATREELHNKAWYLSRLGYGASQEKKLQQAVEFYKQALDIREQLAKQEPDRYLNYLPGVLQSLALSYKALKDYPKAQAQLQRALQLSEHMAEAKTPESIERLIYAYYNLADISLYTHDYIKAENYMREAIRLNKTLKTPKKGLEGNLAPALLLQGKYAEAWELYKLLVNTPNPSREGKTFGHGCMDDLERLTAERLIPSEHQEEVHKVIEYLKKNNR